MLKRHARSSKYDPYVDEVDLIEANPLYAHVKFRNGREDTVALKNLAPAGSLVPSGQTRPDVNPNNLPSLDQVQSELDPTNINLPAAYNHGDDNFEEVDTPNTVQMPTISGEIVQNDNADLVPSSTSKTIPNVRNLEAPRRSNRARRPPDRLIMKW